MNSRPRANADGKKEEHVDPFTTVDTGGGYSSNPDVLSIVATLVLIVAFTSIAGLRGVAAGLVTVAVWYAIGIPYAVGAGHITLVGLFPDGIDLFSLVAIEITFVILLLVSGPRTSKRIPVRYTGVALASVGALASIVWFVLVPATQPIWVAAIALVVAFGCAAYGIHRYELVYVLSRLESVRVEQDHRSNESDDRSGAFPSAAIDDSSRPSNRDTEHEQR